MEETPPPFLVKYQPAAAGCMVKSDDRAACKKSNCHETLGSSIVWYFMVEFEKEGTRTCMYSTCVFTLLMRFGHNVERRLSRNRED